MSYLSYTKEFTGPDQVILRTPNRYMPLVEFLEETCCQPSELTVAEREVLASYVSQLNKSSFCTAIHNGVARAYGVEDKAIPSVAASQEDESSLQPIFVFIRKLLMQPAEFTADDVQALVSSGWSEQTVEDVIGLVSSVTVYNLMSVGFGFLSAEDEYFNGLGEAVKENGYLPLFQEMLKTQ